MALNIWEAVVPMLALGGTAGTLVGVWWRVSSENELRKKDISLQDARLDELEKAKAEKVDLTRVIELVAKMSMQMDAHHLDDKRHRTPDFELRLETFYKGVQDFMNENRLEHKEILDELRTIGVK